MLKQLLTSCLPVIFLLSTAFSVSAQCNVNDKYDKIISGYHSSIALKDNGTYCVWGSYMKTAGNADQLAPQDINVTNYPSITGTIYKASLGGKNAGAQVDQAFVLTSTGLWAWGVAGNVVSTGVKTGNTFGRTSTTLANGFNTYGLPASITPTEVASLFATYQTLVLVTTSGRPGVYFARRFQRGQWMDDTANTTGNFAIDRQHAMDYALDIEQILAVV